MHAAVNAYLLGIHVFIPARLCRPGRHFCQLGELASQVGWKHFDLIKVRVYRSRVLLRCLLMVYRTFGGVQRLEANRKTRSSAFFQKKREAGRALAVAAAKVDGTA